ncbi:SacI homology domain-containing protein [Globomyces pollinis-pini]|nr:SacI homology domain-containing protein [Globomyces pollinis-pini]
MSYSTLVFTEHPRTLAIKPASNISDVCLTFKAEKDGSCLASFTQNSLDGYALLHQKTIHGCVGVVSVDSELFVGVITEATRQVEIEGHNIFVINKVVFHCISNNNYDTYFNEPERTSYPTTEELTNPTAAHPCALLMKYLASGSFYFSKTFDLTRNLQDRVSSSSQQDVTDTIDHNYVWNKALLSELIRIKQQDLDPQIAESVNSSGLLVPIIQGFVGCENTLIGKTNSKIAIISRLSSNRAGTRFNARGIDDDGFVSNFVETEFLIYTGSLKSSFLQLRGSIPLFWEQTGVQVSHKIKISRGLESTIHSTRKHFEQLIEKFSDIQIVNLLGQTELSNEFALNNMYKTAVLSLTDLQSSLHYHAFDFHVVIKRDQYDRLEELAGPLRPRMNQDGFFVFDTSLDTVIQRQNGVIRTNCLDCLDRTNVVQTLFAKEHLKMFTANMSLRLNEYDSASLLAAFNNLWADNGDWLSRIYAGTGALKSSYTRNGKSTVFGLLNDAAKSVNRFYVSNFQDKSRQEAIDMLMNSSLTIKAPGMGHIDKHLQQQRSQYSSTSELTVLCGTYNFNGKLPHNESLESWLRPASKELADIVVIGCQELIQLTPGEYITADTEKLKTIWQDAILKTLQSFPNSDYVLVRSLHLVALGLFLYVRQPIAARMRELQTASVKTGLLGMAANKGGVGIRMKIDDTSLVFVTAHFAAGQSMVEERNRDYFTINQGLSFKNIHILDHDMIFWFGDFNYRLNGENSEVREMVQKKNYKWLLSEDQLNQQRSKRLAFPLFEEGEIKFDPTYKYDSQSRNYDTSEKARVPSWTDRVLYKGDGIRLLEYNRGEQLMSDHRPGMSICIDY